MLYERSGRILFPDCITPKPMMAKQTLLAPNYVKIPICTWMSHSLFQGELVQTTHAQVNNHKKGACLVPEQICEFNLTVKEDFCTVYS